ncbi:MAG: OadG family protein [Candidatus Sedimenticola sp. (ex Thyasira tokunagai)]
MPISDLLMQGVNLMLLGMGSVFIFLSVLVLAMYGMSSLARAISKEDIHTGAPSAAVVTKASDDEGELIAVITAAISRFRSSDR